MRYLLNAFAGACLGLALCFLLVIPVMSAIMMPDAIRLTAAELGRGQAIQPVTFLHGVYDRTATVDGEPETYVDLKLFGIFKIRRVKVDLLPFDNLIAGGVPIAFTAKVNGAIVLNDTKDFRRGDIITNFNGKEITSVEDFDAQMNGKARLGLWLKDETNGVGMLTYVNPDNNNFAALGHKLTDHETGAAVDARAGEVYQCNIIGIVKGEGRKTGELQSTMKKGTGGAQGSVLSSNDRGVYGCLNETARILALCKDNVYPVVSRYSVKPGKATVLMALDGENVEEYDIEIIKTRYQKQKQSKGLVLRVTDKRLLERAGGIIHGMSGSPIIQNGHLVGAITHVMVGDSTKGYGIYIDFILPV